MARRGMLALTLLLFVTTVVLANVPVPGKIVEVACKASSQQRYSCYLPSRYDPKMEWPILYCFSPNATGDAFTHRYRAVCEERGWIVVGSMNSRNGPWGPIQAAIDAMWADTEARFNLSKTMRYATGFSGGARVSFALAHARPEHISGVIAIGAGLSSTGGFPRKGFPVAMFCGETDFNRKELDALEERLKAAGNPLLYETFPGGHDMAPVALLAKAVAWLDDQAVERRAARLAAALEESRRLDGEGDTAAAWRHLVEALEATPAGIGPRKEAASWRRKLERKPAAKAEAKALARLEKARAWIAKNAERIERFPAPRAQAVKKLRDVVENHAGTLAAERAASHLEELDAE